MKHKIPATPEARILGAALLFSMIFWPAILCVGLLIVMQP